MSGDNKSKLPVKVAVIDSDSAMATITSKLLKVMGIPNVDIFLEADPGYAAIGDGTYDAAFIDWKLKGTASGLALLSRLRRQSMFVYLPVIVTSGVVKREDLRILQDYQCTRVMEKPLKQREQREVVAELTTIMDESKWYAANERQITHALNAASMDAGIALKAIENILSGAPNSAPFSMIAAKHLMNNNFLKESLELYNKALAKDPTFLPAYNGKAKVLTKMGKFKPALEVLKDAQKLSPQNIERLSLMGEIEISLKHPEQAVENFRKALGIDAKDVRAKVGLAVSEGMSKVVALQTSNANEDMSVAKMINNLGVNLARQGQYEKASKYYLMSFAFVATQDLQTRVSFNLGLGFKKWGKLPQAKYWLEKSRDISKGTFSKPERHLDELGHIVAVPGLGGSGPAAKVPPTPLKAAPVPVPAPKPSPKVALPDEDLSFLEEETVSIVASGQGPISNSAATAKALQSLTLDIDSAVAFDDSFVFDDPI
jgi:tetratricopeptide (TPR) repeat protein